MRLLLRLFEVQVAGVEQPFQEFPVAGLVGRCEPDRAEVRVGRFDTAPYAAAIAGAMFST